MPGTSLGDVHTLCLYPLVASHRDVPPKQRARLGITDNLVRFSIGIEAAEDNHRRTSSRRWRFSRARPSFRKNVIIGHQFVKAD